MTYLTEDETLVLRLTLGLSYWNRDNPTRNRSHGIDIEKYQRVMDNLAKRGYMATDSTYGESGKELYWKATPAGIEAIRDQPFRD
jgi:hypothetical protein